MVSFDDFKQLDIVVAKILNVEDHPNADKLYVVNIDIGGETRKIVAGIRPHYKKEDLINRKIIVIKNLEPATIRGIESNGMLLATKDSNGLALLVPDRDIEIGSPIS